MTQPFQKFNNFSDNENKISTWLNPMFIHFFQFFYCTIFFSSNKYTIWIHQVSYCCTFGQKFWIGQHMEGSIFCLFGFENGSYTLRSLYRYSGLFNDDFNTCCDTFSNISGNSFYILQISCFAFTKSRSFSWSINADEN